MNLKQWILLFLVATLSVAVAIRYWSGDERAIRKQIGLVEALGSKAGDEKSIESLLRARQLAALFTDPSTLQVDAVDFSGAYSRKQIQDRIVMTRGFYTRATVVVHDLNITLTDKENAAIRCTLRVKGEGKNRPVADVQEMEAAMRKIQGDWLFSRLTLVEVLEQ